MGVFSVDSTVSNGFAWARCAGKDGVGEYSESEDVCRQGTEENRLRGNLNGNRRNDDLSILRKYESTLRKSL